MGTKSIGHATDGMIRKLQKELEERASAAEAIVANANDADRDLNKSEEETLSNLRDRMESLNRQLDSLEATSNLKDQVNARMRDFDRAITAVRKVGQQDIDYRTAGHWALDSYKAAMGDRQAQERLELFYRAADHQTTPDNLGVIPDPIVGNVINFIDAARPLVNFIGAQSMPYATWHRPVVTRGTKVLVQGDYGDAADEKEELASQKMLITRLTANAVTYGGYVNVSRQNIDFSSPQIMDIIINDLAARYAIQTESALAAEMAATTTAAVGYGVTPTAATVAAAVWEAISQVYTATRGQGRVGLAVAPDRLSVFGPLFAPVNPQNAQSPGFTAANFGQGVMGTISGVPVIMSAGLGTGEAYAFSTAALEAFEQRVGTLQVTEPSVLGVQVAYAGYFTALTIEDDAIVPLEAADDS